MRALEMQKLFHDKEKVAFVNRRIAAFDFHVSNFGTAIAPWRTIHHFGRQIVVWEEENDCATATLRDLTPGTDTIHPSRWPVLRPMFGIWRVMRRWFSRRDWTIRLLNLKTSEGTADEPGVILLQIDGLARPQLKKALAEGRMPFLRGVIQRENYAIQTMYPGIPTTTPAVLGELYYGVSQVVPAWGFRDHRSGQTVEMMQPSIASTVQDELAAKSPGLLEGGSAYCTIYTGGAEESQLCPGGMRWTALDDVSFWKKAVVLLLNVAALLRMIGMSLVEFCLACWDFLTGKRLFGEFLSELTFIPRRVFGTVILREIAAIGAEVDATRGLPIIHVNFLGYDEQAHRRGPDSRTAHFTLRGIDRALQRIWNAANGSRRRDYQVWFFSDHGQQRVAPYQNLYGRTLQDAVWEIEADERGLPGPPKPDEAHSSVVAIGPVGNIYWPPDGRSHGEPRSADEVDRLAHRFVSEAKIPIVLAKREGRVFAWTSTGRHPMPEAASEVLGADHPDLPDVGEDFTRLCLHPDAGDFVVSGWRIGETPLSFVGEHGAHGGPGTDETNAFLLLPPNAPAADPETKLRPVVLRQMIRTCLRRDPEVRRVPLRRNSETLRLVTYNVHSCIGMDGRMSPVRIARILAELDPDVIALQELDVGRSRTGGIDQAQRLADLLEMDLQFHPSFNMREEQYGNAVLSRLPMKRIAAGTLPTLNARCEPRGVLWVELELGENRIHLVTTHLGTSSRERAIQGDVLLGENWLSHPNISPHAILCGDLNAVPRSHVYRRIASRFQDVQTGSGKRPKATWFGPLPLRRIDHIFVTENFRVLQSLVPRTRRTQVSSDHLPLVTDLALLPLALPSKTHERPATAVR